MFAFLARRERHLRRLIAACALFLILAGSVQAHPIGPDAATTATIAAQTSSPSTDGCNATRVEIWAKDMTGLYGIDVRVTFDPNSLQVVDADPNADGVQITPLSGFLKPDFVVKKIACNAASGTNPDCPTAGLIWYAATETAPTAPATGSGALAAIDFVGVAAGLSSLQITYSEPVDIHGAVISAATADAQLNVGPPAAPVTAMSLPSPVTPRLSWGPVPGANVYRMYRDVMPYFTPAEPPYASTSLLSYDDTGAAGDPQVNHFYALKAVCGSGLASAPGNRTGEFDFRLMKP